MWREISEAYKIFDPYTLGFCSIVGNYIKDDWAVPVFCGSNNWGKGVQGSYRIDIEDNLSRHDLADYFSTLTVKEFEHQLHCKYPKGV